MITWKIVKDERVNEIEHHSRQLHCITRCDELVNCNRNELKFGSQPDDFNEIGHFAIGQSKICAIQ